MNPSTESLKEKVLLAFLVFGSITALAAIFFFSIIYFKEWDGLSREKNALQDVKEYKIQDNVMTIRSDNDEKLYFIALYPTYKIKPNDKIQIRVKEYAEGCGPKCVNYVYKFEGLFNNGFPMPYKSYHAVPYKDIKENKK